MDKIIKFSDTGRSLGTREAARCVFVKKNERIDTDEASKMQQRLP